MSHFTKAQELVKGDHIDLLLVSEEIDHDLIGFSADVDYVSIEGDEVRIVTDSGALTVPLNYEVIVFTEE